MVQHQKNQYGSEQEADLFYSTNRGKEQEMPGLQMGQNAQAVGGNPGARQGLVREETFRNKQAQKHGVF